LYTVTEPDKARAVFVLARKDCPPVRLPEYVANIGRVFFSHQTYSGTALEMRKGHISLTPYSVVEQLIARGEVELV